MNTIETIFEFFKNLTGIQITLFVFVISWIYALVSNYTLEGALLELNNEQMQNVVHDNLIFFRFLWLLICPIFLLITFLRLLRII